jgi:zeaxanthin glucosyltransferase
MAHFGVICPGASGHFNPMSAVTSELMQRGHRCTYFQFFEWENAVRSTGADFQPLGVQEYPEGTRSEVLDRLGRTKGLESLKFTIEVYRREGEIICRDVPPAAKRLGIDTFLVDQSQGAGTTVAEHLGLPAVSLCMAMLLNQDEQVPPSMTNWRYQLTWWARLRNRAVNFSSNLLTRPILDALNQHRQRWGLPLVKNFNQTFSPLAQISQQPHEFEFPRSNLPETFHFCGPLRKTGADRPFEGELEAFVSSNTSFVYGSLGTIQNRKKELFWTMAETCAELGLPLVIAHAGALDEKESRSLPGETLAVPWAPQPAILKGAALCITHCGLNTVLDALSQGIPCIGLPRAHEQPAIANRLEWSGAGINLGSGAVPPSVLKSAIKRVLSESAFREAAKRLQTAIANAGGVGKAADICEQVASSRRAVFARR